MKTLVFGASGATGKLVVMQLIKKNISTRVLVRKSAAFPKEMSENPLVEIVEGNINDLGLPGMKSILNNCNVVISCLGHNVSLKGLFGRPRYLVLDAVRTLSEAVTKETDNKIRLILMSTTAFTNSEYGEKNSIAESIIFFLLMFFLPPHRDNVKAANFIINEIGEQNEKIEWVGVRPDTLINDNIESAYDICESPKRSPLFDSGNTSRINVSHFMAELVTNEELWNTWLFKTPVIYNSCI